MEAEKFKKLMCGPAVIVFTPFKNDGNDINEKELRKNVNYMIDNGIKTGQGVLIPGGSVGDCFVMSLEERKKVFEIVIDEADDRVPIVCGTNHTSTRIAVQLSKYVEKIGGDGVMVTPPFYYKNLFDEAIYKHYQKISDEIDIGIMIYNNTQVMNVDLSLELLQRLSELENVLAIKESTRHRIKFKKVVEKLGDKISILNGGAEEAEPESYMMGSRGFITAFANFVPGLCRDIHKEALNKNYQKVKEIIDPFRPLMHIMYGYLNKYGPAQAGRIYKEMANLLGFNLGSPRLPILSLPDSYRKKLKNTLKEEGFFDYVNKHYHL